MKNMCMGACNSMMSKCGGKNTGLLLIRISLAVVFLGHGIAKLTDMEGTIGFFASLGLGAFFAWLVAIVEVVGGLMMLLGAWTCVAGGLLAVTMIFAIILVKAKIGFPAVEIDIAMLASALAIMLMGPGKYGLNKCCSRCVGEAGCCGGSCSCESMKCDGCETNCKDGVCSGHEGK